MADGQGPKESNPGILTFDARSLVLGHRSSRESLISHFPDPGIGVPIGNRDPLSMEFRLCRGVERPST
jgi:hypothetical protein